MVKFASTSKFVDINRRADLAFCEQILFDRLQTTSEYSIRLASQFGAGFFSDVWASIVVGTLCRHTCPPTQVITWGSNDWDPKGTFASSIPGLTSLQMAQKVVTENFEGAALSQVEERIARFGRGVVEDNTGKSRTLVEFDPQQPVAIRLEAPTSAQQTLLFNNLIHTFRGDLELGSRNRKLSVSSRGEISSLTQFLSELHENSYKYARSLVQNNIPQRGLRIVRLKAHLSTSREDLIRRGAAFPLLNEYLEAIAYGAGSHGLMEASISDFGSGILNHFLSSSRGASYLDQPRATLMHKLIHESLSSSNNPSAGHGLPRVLRAASSLRAFVSLRSNEFWLAQSFADPSASTELQAVRLPNLAHIAGTHWQFLWPMGL